MNASHNPSRGPDAGSGPWQTRGGPLRPAAHLLALWAFAVAQPVYDVLGRNGEFFIAHRTQPPDLVLLAVTASLVLPLLLLVLPYLAARAVSARLGQAALIGLIGLLSGMLASQVMAHRVTLPVAAHFAVAGGVGAAAAWLYAARPGVRTFLTMLSPSVLVFPALFLLQPSMSMFVRPDGRHVEAAAVIDRPVPPIVFVVFDQLPLVSLMDASGRIDRARYPGFAALADNATWYRGATTVAEFTGWALPPLVSGIRPNAQRVPTTRSYPHNLFTWLGGRYRLEVLEPITQLCPEQLCESRRAPLPVRLAAMTLDSSVVYLTVALPAGLRAHLPPLTENWKDFIQDQRWQRRWVAESRDDRRQVPRELIASISRDDPQPTLYFAHALLPHEPYIYLRSGQEFAADPYMPGITRTGRWTSDDWPVTEAYLRHLLQVEYVDGVVGQLIARLQAEGLYEQSLIVVTSDHGASFRPDGQFKALEAGNASEIMSVPLFIKAPGQREAVIDDSNVQSIDVMPSIASRIGVPLTWTPEGVAAGEPRPGPAVKAIRHGGARLNTTFDASELMKARDAAVARKVAMFGSGPGWRPAAVRRADLIGTRVGAFEAAEGPWQAVVDDPDALASVDPAGPSLPVRLTGWVRDQRGDPADAELVVAVNGTVAAVTRTWGPDVAARGTWSALVNPALLVAGRNDVRVYVLADGDALHLAYASRLRPAHLNLASRGAEEFWAVTQSGFYPREGGPVPHRWTNGEGTLVVPVEPDRRPRSLRIGLADVTPSGTPLTLTLGGCTLFSGRVDQAPWYRTFSLRDCPPDTLAAPQVRLVIATPPWTADQQRPQGVAVETVNLFESDWPVTGSDPARYRGAIRAIGEQAGAGRTAGDPMTIEVVNTGEGVWLPPADSPGGGGVLLIALRWQRLAGGRAYEQRLNLPHAVYPSDRAVLDAPLVPPAELRDMGPWTASLSLVTGQGSTIPLEAPFAVEVNAPGGRAP